MEIPDNIYTLIAKKLDGEASPDEIRMLEGWLLEAKSNQATFRQLQDIHSASITYLQQPVDTEKAWSKLEGKLQTESKVVNMAPVRSFRRILSIAAILMVVIIAAWFARAVVLKSSWEKTIASGSNVEQKLPDGSLVSLRKGSTLEWKSDFASNREVRLNGEAYFDVQHDAGNRFTVTTPQSVTTVMGTAFMIRSRGGFDPVTVTRGKVNVASVIENKPAALLLPGEKLVLSKDKLLRSSVSDSNFMAWKTGQLEFREMNLDKVLKVLGEFYQVPISMNSPSSPPITVSFDNESIEKAIEKVSKLTGLEAEKQDDGSWIYSKK